MFFLSLVNFYLTSQHHFQEGGNVQSRVECFGLNRLLCFKLADLRISGATNPIFLTFNGLQKKVFTYHHMEYRRNICVIPLYAFLIIIIIIIIIIVVVVVVDCNWAVILWQWLFYMYTKYEIGYY